MSFELARWGRYIFRMFLSDWTIFIRFSVLTVGGSIARLTIEKISGSRVMSRFHLRQTRVIIQRSITLRNPRIFKRILSLKSSIFRRTRTFVVRGIYPVPLRKSNLRGAYCPSSPNFRTDAIKTWENPLNPYRLRSIKSDWRPRAIADQTIKIFINPELDLKARNWMENNFS